MSASKKLTWPEKEIREIIVIFFGFTTLYIAYASMRNQLRLAAEADINQEGFVIYNIEMSDPNVRCLYGNFGFDDPNNCLNINTSNAGSYSKAEFYVEESLYALHKSVQDAKTWHSHYEDDIFYWQQDVEQDPTGLFSYYIVSRYGLEKGKKYFSDANLCIVNICNKYESVYNRLSHVDKNFQSRNSNRCLISNIQNNDRTMQHCTPRPFD